MRYWNDNLYLTEDELAHYGVLGMKWGVRRYQNYDGSLIGAASKTTKSAGNAVSDYWNKKKNRKNIVKNATAGKNYAFSTKANIKNKAKIQEKQNYFKNNSRKSALIGAGAAIAGGLAVKSVAKKMGSKGLVNNIIGIGAAGLAFADANVKDAIKIGSPIVTKILALDAVETAGSVAAITGLGMAARETQRKKYTEYYKDASK